MIVGVDWSQRKHDVVLMNEDGRTLARLAVGHDAQGIEQLAHVITEHEPDPARVRITVEMHDGALLAWLIDQEYQVFGINPKSAQRARDRYRPAGGKDDGSDAFILADMLRTDRGTLRIIQPHSDATVELRALVELRAERVRQRTKLFQRLRDRLDQWAPGVSVLCDDLNRDWQRRLLEQFPLQQDLQQAHHRTIAAFIRQHRLGAKTAQRIKAAHRTAPIPIAQPRIEALRLDIRQMLRQIDLLADAIAQLDDLIEDKVQMHPDARVFQSLPVKGTNTIAAFMAGFGEDRDHAPDHDQLAAAWGVAPITIASGKKRSVRRRLAMDQTLNQALLHFAFNTAFVAGCWAADYYQRKRTQGKAHYTALRCLAQRWLKILHRLWKTKSTYDEQRHQQRIQIQQSP